MNEALIYIYILEREIFTHTHAHTPLLQNFEKCCQSVVDLCRFPSLQKKENKKM